MSQNNPCASYCQPDQSNTALKRKENISRKKKKSQNCIYLRCLENSSYKWSILWPILSAGIKETSERGSMHLTDTSSIFSPSLQCYSHRNLHRTPVLAAGAPAHSTAWRGVSQSACGFTELHCALSSHQSHCPFLPTFDSQVRGMGKSTLSFCLLGSL